MGNENSTEGFMYTHDLTVGGEDIVHHTIYSPDRQVSGAGSPEEVSRIIDPICLACMAIYNLVNSTRSMRKTDGEVDAWCSVYDSSVNMKSKKPTYISLDVRCPLIESGKFQKKSEI